MPAGGLEGVNLVPPARIWNGAMLEVVQGHDRPAVVAVSIEVLVGHRVPGRGPLEQRGTSAHRAAAASRAADSAARPPLLQRRPTRTGGGAARRPSADQGRSSQSSSSQSVSARPTGQRRSIAARDSFEHLASSSRSSRNGDRFACRSLRATPVGRHRTACGTSGPADNDDRPRTHVLLLAHDGRDAFAHGYALKASSGCSSSSRARWFGRGHRRGQVEEPARIGGESAHHLQGAIGVLLADRRRLCSRVVDDPLAEHVVDVERRQRPGGRVALVGASGLTGS